MSPETRARYKQLANDSIIATFGRDDNEARLAQALEKCVDELDNANDKCPTCSRCENHGDHGDEFTIDVNEIIRVHGELKKRLAALKELHGEFDDVDEVTDIPDMVSKLGMQIEEFESEVDELEAEVLP